MSAHPDDFCTCAAGRRQTPPEPERPVKRTTSDRPDGYGFALCDCCGRPISELFYGHHGISAICRTCRDRGKCHAGT